MAGSIINLNGSSSITVTNLIEILDATRVGYENATLTNLTTTTPPTIGGGSIVEVGGSLYRFNTEETISTSNVTSTSDATWYVEIIPSSSEVTAQFTTETPAWRYDYQGYYLSTTSNNRILNNIILFNNAIYNSYKIFNSNDNNGVMLTGTTSTNYGIGQRAQLSYPDGYNSDNSYVDCLGVYSTDGYWQYGKYDSISITDSFAVIRLRSTYIDLYIGDYFGSTIEFKFMLKLHEL